MSLYNLKREYEERRSALVEQLQRNPSLDPATQHQIYGAIKEIESFLKTIDYQIASEQEKHLDVNLSSQKPSPFVERTKGAVYHVARGTKKLFAEHIPNVAKKAVFAPKQYFDKRKEEARLRREIEAELVARRNTAMAPIGQDHVTLEHPHQELTTIHEEPVDIEDAKRKAGLADAPTWSDETVQKTEPLPAEQRPANRVKRPKVIARAAKTKNHPSKNAPGKKGGQHKPHLKKDKANRYHRK